MQNTLIAGNAYGDYYAWNGCCDTTFLGDPKLNLLPGSPAINAGDNSVCPKMDQRGWENGI